MASQFTGVSIVYSTVCLGADKRKHQSSASLAFVRKIHRWPVNSPHKDQLRRKCFHLMTSWWYIEVMEVTKIHFSSLGPGKLPAPAWCDNICQPVPSTEFSQKRRNKPAEYLYCMHNCYTEFIWGRMITQVNHPDFVNYMNVNCINVSCSQSSVNDCACMFPCFLFVMTSWHGNVFPIIGPFWTWWRHQMETFSALLALCAGDSPVSGEFPSQRPVTRSFDVFFDLRLNKRLSKQSWGWWLETPPCSLWRHRYGGKSTLERCIPITVGNAEPFFSFLLDWTRCRTNLH